VERLAAENAALDGVAACPFHPEFTGRWSARHAYWRKPGPGMIDLLVTELNIAARRCWMISGAMIDVLTARAAGLSGAILLSREDDADAAAVLQGATSPLFEVALAEDLADALAVLSVRIGLSAGVTGTDLTSSPPKLVARQPAIT